MFQPNQTGLVVRWQQKKLLAKLAGCYNKEGWQKARRLPRRQVHNNVNGRQAGRLKVKGEDSVAGATVTGNQQINGT